MRQLTALSEQDSLIKMIFLLEVGELVNGKKSVLETDTGNQ